MNFDIGELKDKLSKRLDPSFLPFEDNQATYRSFGVTPRRKLGFLWLLLLHEFTPAEIPVELLLNRPRRTLVLGNSSGVLLGTDPDIARLPRGESPPQLPQPKLSKKGSLESADTYMTRLEETLAKHKQGDMVVGYAKTLQKNNIDALKKQLQQLENPSLIDFDENVETYQRFNVTGRKRAGFLWLLLLHRWNRAKIPKALQDTNSEV